MPIFRLMPYLRGMRDMGIDEAVMAKIEAEIIAHPIHPMIRGLKGARKARIQRPGMGKRGGARVVYYVAIGSDRFYMMAAYAKSERDDLSIEQRRRILAALESIKKPES
jgi:hypothetical protein